LLQAIENLNRAQTAGQKRKLADQSIETVTETKRSVIKKRRCRSPAHSSEEEEGIRPAHQTKQRRLSPASAIGNTSEGLSLFDPVRTDRKEMCSKLLELLKKDRVVLLRAPPETGKTSLATLLPPLFTGVVKYVSFLGIHSIGFDECWRQYMGECFLDTLDTQEETLLILDEVQMIYSLGEQHRFWWSIKELQQQSHHGTVRILLLAAYGNGPSVLREAGANTPIGFNHAQDYSLLQLSKEEFAEIISTHNGKEKKKGNAVYIHSATSDLLESMCGGHVGLVRQSLNLIQNHFHEAAKHNPPKDEDMCLFLLSGSYFTGLATNSRAVPTGMNLSDRERNLICQLLLAPKDRILWNSATFGEKNDPATSLIHMGVLTVVDVELTFASPLIHHIMAKRLYVSEGSFQSLFISASNERKLLNILALIDPQIMRRSWSIGEDMTVLERQWQMEFYRAASLILPDASLSPDVGRLLGSKGFLDFYIDSDYKWGIELLRNGSRLKEHLARFQPGGIYAELKNQLKDYHVIDFCKEGSAKAVPTGMHHWIVYYNESFTSARVVKSNTPEGEVIKMGVVKRDVFN
jgi:hypothetical protein